MARLSTAQRRAYETDGFVRLEEAFPTALAERAVDGFWTQLDEDRDDPSTWRRPVVRLHEHADPVLTEIAGSPRWRAAIHEIAGPDAAPTPWLGGTTAVRFPVEGDPGDDGWHIDGSYTGPDGTYWANHRSRDRALLMLVLFTDVGADDAPTRLRPGSHRLVPDALAAAGDDGVSVLDLDLPEAVADLPIDVAVGRPGDVYLCHPFLVHAAQRHHGRDPRFVAQPGVPWRPRVDGFPEP